MTSLKLLFFGSLQVQQSDTVTGREGGWNRTFTTAPRLHLLSSTSLYVGYFRDVHIEILVFMGYEKYISLSFHTTVQYYFFKKGE